MTRPARVVINLSGLKHNLKRVRELAPQASIVAIVKADAYGHGLTRTARALKSVDAFGVACLEEAMELREAGVHQKILLLEGPYSDNEIDTIRKLNLDIVVHDLTQIELLERVKTAERISVWMKIDTGMHRLGFMPENVKEIWHRLRTCASVTDKIFVMTHLAAANENNNAMTNAQLECFTRVCPQQVFARSIANSAGILAYPESHAEWVRPGLMLYGVSPLLNSTGEDHGLQPVMTLTSKLISIKQLKKNDPVGYGATWHCPEDMSVGVVAAGYADGYPRHAPSGTPLLVNGKRALLIGRASMDMLIVDLRDHTNARVGDPVILWGEGLPVEELARYAGTIPYELLCAIHKRLQFTENGQV